MWENRCGLLCFSFALVMAQQNKNKKKKQKKCTQTPNYYSSHLKCKCESKNNILVVLPKQTFSRFFENLTNFLESRIKHSRFYFVKLFLYFFSTDGFSLFSPDTVGFGLCAWLLTIISFLLVICTFPFSIIFCLKVCSKQVRSEAVVRRCSLKKLF